METFDQKINGLATQVPGRLFYRGRQIWPNTDMLVKDLVGDSTMAVLSVQYAPIMVGGGQ